jgi:hypothetical protein
MHPTSILNFRVHIILFLLAIVLLSGCSTSSNDVVVIENRKFRYEITPDGQNIAFKDKDSGLDYLKKDSITWCAMVTKDGIREMVSSVTFKRKHLILKFNKTDVIADILINEERDRVGFQVNEVTGDPESLNFLNIPLNLEGMPYEPFAACALSMNLFTHVRQIPALQTHLWATCYKRFGMKGSEITLVGAPLSEMLPLIRDIVSHAEGIPFSDKGGAWALMQKEGYGSYLMNFGTLSEETVDDWIEMCRSLGFNQIDNHGGGDFFRFGDFELNKKKWPDGWESFRRINEKLHDSEITSIFHTYAFFIDKNSPYVTPSPSHDLAWFRTFTVAEPVGEGDSEITVNEPTSEISTTTGFFVRNSFSLRIGDEIIEFKGVTKTPPYKFTGCRRGACGTGISAHLAGDTAYHLKEMFNRFLPGPETKLFDEIAGRTAAIVNQCRFDGIYFDAIDGSDILGGEENFWYYGTKFIFEVAKHLDRPVGMEMSSMSHHWWHYRSRWQAWDRPVRGYKRFIDIHAAAIKSPRLFLPPKIKSNENEHGLWRGHTPLIEKYAGAENGGLMLPLHLGWWGNQTWNPPQVEPTFPDDIEYLCCKLIGNNAGFSMLRGVDEKTLSENPLISRIVPLIKQYEELRQSGYFNDSIRTLLRQPGREFTLTRDDSGGWNFKPVSYIKHKVEGRNHPSSVWNINNEFKAQPIKLRIEVLMSVKRYDDNANITIADFSHPEQFTVSGHATTVSGNIQKSFDNPGYADNYAMFSASSSADSSYEGQWFKIEKIFDPWLDLSKNQGLGVWIKGDGNGELLNIRLESPKHLSHGARGDHFVKIDFEGWKYFELIEIESSEFSNYIWPDSGFYVYDSYRHTLQFNNIDKIQLWYNNLPSGKESRCILSSIKALPLVTAVILNPTITVNGESLTLPVKMESGMYLELGSGKECRLYGSKGELLKEVIIEGPVPEIQNGENKILFSCDGPGDINPRTQVTMISEGDLLIK